MVVNIVFGIGITALAGALATVAVSRKILNPTSGCRETRTHRFSLLRRWDSCTASSIRRSPCESPSVRAVVCSGRRTCMGVSRHAGKRGSRDCPGPYSCSLRSGRLCDNCIPGQDGKSFQVRPAGRRGHPEVHDVGCHGSCLCSSFLYCHHLLPDQRRAGTPVPAAAARVHLGYHTRCSRIGNRKPVYGKERQYQNQKFGAGVPISASGNIVRYAEAGERNSLDNGFFTAKFGGPASGLCFGLIVFLELWRTMVFEKHRRRSGSDHCRHPDHPDLHHR